MKKQETKLAELKSKYPDFLMETSWVVAAEKDKVISTEEALDLLKYLRERSSQPKPSK